MISNDFSFEQQQAAEQIGQIYQRVAPSNVVAQVFPADLNLKQWAHYPDGDVKDFKNHTQYYYHSHPSKDDDRIPEHGHFHIFLRYPRFSKEETPLFCSPKYQESNGTKDALVHLCAIAMDEYGKPKALFTVNHWVVMGVWYGAERIIRELDSFKVDIADSPYALANEWLTHMITLFKPYIADLLVLRDEVIAEFAKNNPDQEVYCNKSLEVTSVLRLQA